MRQTCMVVLAVLLLYGCGDGNAEARVRGALDVSATPIDAAYGFAMSACILREETIATSAEAGKITVEAARGELAPVRARCDRTRSGFELLRAVHERAVSAVEAGKVAEAEKSITALRAQWASFVAEQKQEAFDGGL